jgi:hypothetical protein
MRKVLGMKIPFRLFLASCCFYVAYGWIGRDNLLFSHPTSSRKANLGAQALDTIHFYFGDFGGAAILSLGGLLILWSCIQFQGLESLKALLSDRSESTSSAIDSVQPVRRRAMVLEVPDAQTFGRRQIVAPPSPVYPEELDVTDLADVRWIMECGDPAIWHQAAMAALAYRGDPHELAC